MKKFGLCILLTTTIFLAVSCTPVENNANNKQENTSFLDQNTTEDIVNLYWDALSDADIISIENAIYDYYNDKIVWKAVSICATDDENRLYQNEGIEAEYQVGNIIIYDVVAENEGEIANRTISVARTKGGAWEVINEGF